MPPNNPTVTVITPAWNLAPYISEAILSVLGQTYQDFEYFVVDDGSSDETLAIAREFEKKDARLRVLHQEHQGLGEARNLALRQARGKFISFLDGDDYWKSNFLERMISTLESRGPDCTAVFSWSENFSPAQKNKIIWKTCPQAGDYDLTKMMEGLNPPGNGSCLVLRRQGFTEAGEFSNQIVGQDSDMWLRLLKASPMSRFFCLPEKLVARRLRKDSLWKSHHAERLEIWQKRLEEYVPLCDQAAVASIYYMFIKNAVAHLNPPDSTIIHQWCRKAIKADFFWVAVDPKKWPVFMILLFGIRGYRRLVKFKNSK